MNDAIRRNNHDRRQRMKNITIALPEPYIIGIEYLCDIKLIPSRSEGIRTALREFLKKDILFLQKLAGLNNASSHSEST